MHEKPARVPRFYTGAALRAGATTQLPEEAAHHAVHVLRLRAGEALTLFNGQGGEYAGRVAAIERLRVTVDVLAHRALERESPLAVTLVQGVSSSEKMDFTVQKATELGVAAQKRAHWQRVAVAACEQCGRNRLPQILAPLPLEEYCRKAAPAGALLLTPEAQLGLREAATRLQGTATLAAGPEAGFTAAEEAMLAQAGFLPVRLGPRVLRTETAALAALAALNALAGDF